MDGRDRTPEAPLDAAEVDALRRRIGEALEETCAWTQPDTLTAARRARTRRRAHAAVLAAAATVALAAAVPAAMGGGDDDAGGPVVGGPAPTPGATSQPPGTQAAPPGLSDKELQNWRIFVQDGALAQLEADGTLFLRPDVEVVQRQENPARVEPPDRSLALVVEAQGERSWVYLFFRDDGPHATGSTSAVVSPDKVAPTTFAAWVAERNRLETGRSAADPSPLVDPDDPRAAPLVGLGADGLLDAVAGVEVLSEEVLLDRAGEHAVAVRFVHDERERWAVLWAETKGGRQTASTARSTFASDGSTFDAWVAANAVDREGNPFP